MSEISKSTLLVCNFNISGFYGQTATCTNILHELIIVGTDKA